VVTPDLVGDIHDFVRKTWIAATSAAMTK